MQKKENNLVEIIFRCKIKAIFKSIIFVSLIERKISNQLKKPILIVMCIYIMKNI